MKLPDLASYADALKPSDRMPVLFLGHGSPMNALEDNEFTRAWKKLGADIPKPQAILCISAHWLTRGTAVTAMEKPPTLHDFGGFPQALFDVQYPAPGSPAIAAAITQAITATEVALDKDWGLDHGAWSVIMHLYPKAQIPVLQLSIDYPKPGQYHYDLAKQLSALRRKGVLILGSGNMVHNLRKVAWDRVGNPNFGFDWALEMNSHFKRDILAGNHAALIHYEKYGEAGKLAIPTPDHYYPLLYPLALAEKGEAPVFFNDQALGGALTMTSVRWG